MELSHYRGSLMTEEEVKALMTIKPQLSSVVDPLCIASQMLDNGNISRDLHEAIQRNVLSGYKSNDVADFLISNLPFHTRFVTIIQILQKCGYSQLASKLFLQFSRSQTGICVIRKRQVETRTHLESFYTGLNSKIQDGQFKNPREALDQLARRFMSKFEAKLDPREKTRTAEKCVAILSAQIVAHAITHDTTLPQNELFSQLSSLIPYTETVCATDVVHFAGKAYANFITMNEEDGEKMLTAARDRICNTGACIELTNVLLVETYCLLCKYEKSPTAKIRDDILMWGKIGLDSLEEENDDTKIYWRRLFILAMVFGLLGIGQRATIIPGAKVDDKSIKMAEQLLADVDQNMEGLEIRREMFYRVARARLNQLMGRLDDALIQISLAERLAESGQYEEVTRIRETKSALKRACADRDKILHDGNVDNTPLDVQNETSGTNASEPRRITGGGDSQSRPEPAPYLPLPRLAFPESTGNYIDPLNGLTHGGECRSEIEDADLRWISFSDLSTKTSIQIQEQRVRLLQSTPNASMTWEPTFRTLTYSFIDHSENNRLIYNNAACTAVNDEFNDAEETELKQLLSS